MDRKLNKLVGIRTQLGAVANVLEGRSNALAISREATQASRGRVVDADYAEETVLYAREQLLIGAAMGLRAQANASTQQVVSILLKSIQQ